MNYISVILALLFAFNFSVQQVFSQLPWELVNSGTTENLNGVDFITPDTGIVVGDQGFINKTTDGGVTWETKDSGISSKLNAVQFISETRVMAVGNSGVVLRSDDAGETWEQVPLGSSLTLSGISVDMTSGMGLISGATLAMIWTDDFGDSWTPGMGGYMSDFYKAHMTAGDFGIAFGVNSIFQPLLGYTDNAGTSFNMWNFYPTLGSVMYEATAYDGYFFSKELGFVVGRVWNGQGFITQEINWSTNAWNSLFVSTTLRAIDFDGQDHGVTVGGTDVDWIFLETFNGGATWDPPVVNGTGKGFNEVVLVGNTGYAVGVGGQIVKKQIPVGMDNKEIQTVRLHIFPNPAKETANVIVELENPEALNMQIYSTLGRLAKTIEMGDLPAGRNVIQLDLNDLSTGIYTCILKSNNGVASQKLIIK